MTGFEAAQVRKEEAVKRHFRLSGVAQSLIQGAPVSVATEEKFEFAQGKTTFGRKGRAMSRELFHALLHRVTALLAQGKACDHILERLMPASVEKPQAC